MALKPPVLASWLTVLLPHLQPKSLAKRPIDEEILADDVLTREIPPNARIEAVQGVVAHDHVVSGPHSDASVRRVDEQRRHLPSVHVAGNVAGIMAFLGRLVGVKTINFLEMRRVLVQPLAVYDQVPVVVDLDAFTAKRDQPFDVILVRRQRVILVADAPSLENDDIATRRVPEIITHPIHEQMIAGGDLQPDNGIARLDLRRTRDVPAGIDLVAGAGEKIIRREPDGVPLVVKLIFLFEI